MFALERDQQSFQEIPTVGVRDHRGENVVPFFRSVHHGRAEKQPAVVELDLLRQMPS